MCWGRCDSEPDWPIRASVSIVATSPASSARLRKRMALNLASCRLSKGDFLGLSWSLATVAFRGGALGPDAISGLRAGAPGLMSGPPSVGSLIGGALGFLAGL